MGQSLRVAAPFCIKTSRDSKSYYLTLWKNKKLYNAVQKFITLADGREIMIETGKLAKQADGSVVVKQGDTMLLATVVAAKDAKPDADFMPLSGGIQGEIRRMRPLSGRFHEA